MDGKRKSPSTWFLWFQVKEFRKIKIFLILIVVLQKVDSNRGLLLSCVAIVKYNVLTELLSLGL